jgi:hypothetical protein
MEKILLTEKQWIEFCKSLQAGDIIHVESNDFTGHAISFGTADSKGIDPAHSFQYVGDGVGKTIEADPKGTQWHIIDEYRSRAEKGEVRLIVDRVINLTVDELNNMKDKWKQLIGKPYGWMTIVGFGVYGLFNRLTPFGGLFRLLMKNPLANKNSPVCSQSVYLAVTEINRIKPFMKELPFENATPNDLSNWDLLFCDRIMDTYRIGKYNLYDYPQVKK